MVGFDCAKPRGRLLVPAEEPEWDFAKQSQILGGGALACSEEKTVGGDKWDESDKNCVFLVAGGWALGPMRVLFVQKTGRLPGSHVDSNVKDPGGRASSRGCRPAALLAQNEPEWGFCETEPIPGAITESGLLLRLPQDAGRLRQQDAPTAKIRPKIFCCIINWLESGPEV